MTNKESGGFAQTQDIRLRRSVREYAPKDVPRGIVDDILDCARLAPTARNCQPWLIGAVSDKGLLGELAALTDHGKFIAKAPVCFSVFCLSDEKYRIEDGCAAAMNIIHAAWAHGIGTCWIAGDKKAYAKAVGELLKVPPAYGLIALISAGYPAAESHMPSKKPKSEVTFKNKAG